MEILQMRGGRFISYSVERLDGIVTGLISEGRKSEIASGAATIAPPMLLNAAKILGVWSGFKH